MGDKGERERVREGKGSLVHGPSITSLELIARLALLRLYHKAFLLPEYTCVIIHVNNCV